jgi:hypothetical protein
MRKIKEISCTYVHSKNSFAQESIELVDFFTVSGNLAIVLLLIKLKTTTVLFEDLFW